MRLSLRLLSLLPVLLVSAALAGCANDVGPGAAELPIVGGTPGGDPAVLWLYNSAEGGLCTGTLIDPRVVLTAKHCVQAPGATGPVRASSMVVGTGDRFGRGTTFTVQSIYTTPGSYTDRGLTGLVGSDVAVLVLASGPSDITPIPIRRTPPDDLRGMEITAIGFGQIPSGGAGAKYTATGRVTSVSGDLIYVGTLTCSGDSGGPMVTAANEVAGVVSFGNTETCGTGFGAYNAIHNYLDLIDMAIEEGGGCPGDEMVETLCDGRDNDCDGEVDEPCIPIGEACTEDAECVGNACRDTAVGMICTRECDAGRPEIGCGDGFYCSRSAAGACEGWCVPVEGAGDGLPIDAPCTVDAQCASFYCADPGDGTRRCLTSCALGDGSCFAGEVCVALEGACGGCVPEEIVTGLAHGLGESCRSSADCAGSAPCFDDEGAQYCTRACDDASACPGGFHCRDAVCVRGTRGGLGDFCVNNDDCGGTNPFCAMRGDTSWCTSTCDPADPTSCSARFTCVEVGASVSVCVPDGGLLGDACDAAEDCISGVCSEDGVCVRACGVDAPCGPGFECRRTDDGTAALCVRPVPAATGGGCAVGIGRGGAGDGAGAMIAALAALAFFAVRRRARA